MLLRPSRAARGDRPSGPFILNPESPQARGLILWVPCGSGDASDYGPLRLRGSGVTFNVSATTSPSPGLGIGYFGSGSDSYVELPHHASQSSLADMAVSAWVYATSFNTLNGIVSKYNPNPSFLLRYYNGWNFLSPEEASLAGSTALAKTWYHVIGTRTAGVGYIYVNGVQDATAGVGEGTRANTDNILIGRDYTASGRNWLGSIVDVRLYNRGLTAADAWALYEPSTRWDLYWLPSSRVFFDVSAPAAAASQITASMTMVGCQ